MSRNWKTVLGYTPQNTAKTIENKFKRQALKHHPDKGGDPALWLELTRARAAAKNHFGKSTAIVPYKPRPSALAAPKPVRPPGNASSQAQAQAYWQGYARGFHNAGERARVESMAAQMGGRRGKLWAWYQRSQAVQHARDLGWILRNMGLGKKSARAPRNR
jgi:hypothetical protein